ncbi:MAG TPA: putative toxin-antitoxin system toxin component, PIN family [Anaerolineales bacterium]
MIIVLDTNVIISALLSSKASPAEIIQRWEAGEFDIATSPALLIELERALAYERVQKYLRLSKREIKNFLRRFQSSTLTVEPQIPIDVIKSDPDDNRVLECAVAATASFIISGNDHLLELREYRGIVILPPTGFITLLELEDKNTRK